MTWKHYKEIIKEGRLYFSYHDDGKIYEKNCHAEVFSTSNKNTVVKNYYSFDTTPYSKEEIYDYVAFLNECGFPMEISETDLVYKGNDYSKVQNKKFDISITLVRKDYISSVHFKIGLTLQRMLSYFIMQGLHNVIPDALKLYKESKITDPYECLTVAFKGKELNETNDSYYIKNHNLMGGYCDVKIMTKEDLLTIVAKKDLQTIRDINK
jgi:hypothetical protein